MWPRPLEGCIGSGGFAAVWAIGGDAARATGEASGATGATVLKVAHANHELARARLAREAQALISIGPPAVPRVAGHGVLDDGRAWIEMERVSGTNLGEIIAMGPLQIDHVIGLGTRILDALVLVHAAGFAHRDLKPDNIVRTSGARSLVILDLGFARKLPEDPDDPNRAGVQVGSVEYMAPEQAVDATTAGAAADIYAIGCILYELCSGRPPFVGDAAALERAHAALRPPPLGALVPVPAALEQLVHDCLAKQPSRRPPHAADVLARLRDVGDASSGQRTQVSMSVIGAGKQPVALLWAELPKVDRALLGTLTARKVTIVSQRGRKVLGGVAGIEHADPAGAALAAARDLAAAGARVALHLDAVALGHGPSGITLSGPSIERPEDWLPASPWTGVVLTRSFATVVQVSTRPSDAGTGFLTLGDAGKPTEDELFGRDVLLSDLATEAAAALSAVGPGLALLVGDHGIGKTALSRALVPRLVELGARVVSGIVPPPGSGRPGHTALAELVGTPQGPVVRAVGDALRAAARRRPTAIVLDELHLAEHELLDALEYATLGGEPLPLWILGLASPRLDQRRPGFGHRAERPVRIDVPPLDDEAAVAMTAALLHPAAYPPIRALRQIASIAHGNPMHLATLVREIHDRGAIRTRPNGEHFLDTTTLDSLPPIALGPWLAARELANLGVELVALARLCAILGDEIDREEIAAVMHIAEQRGNATTTVDLDVGLGELESHGILIGGRGSYSFRQTLLEEGIYSTTDETERRALHGAALEYWQSKSIDDPAVAERVARHAEAVGNKAVAAEAYARLGAHAHEEHRTLDADQAWQGAVRNLESRERARGRALLGRAQARYRLQRVREAIADLDETLAIAGEIADPILEIEAMLEKATALDWGEDFERSAAVAAQATERLQQLGTALEIHEIDAALADGRSKFRANQFAEAVSRLRSVHTRAKTAGRTESQTIAALLLGPSLVEIDELAESEAMFDELISLCERRNDAFHLGVAYCNRAWLWTKRGEGERIVQDLRIVIQMAREGGHASLERIGTHNLAEHQLWEGVLDEALQLARRSLSLVHGESDVNLDLLLVARVLAARADVRDLHEVLGKLQRELLSPHDQILTKLLERVAENASDWSSELAESRSLYEGLRLELGYLALQANVLDPTLREELRELATQHQVWARRAVF